MNSTLRYFCRIGKKSKEEFVVKEASAYAPLLYQLSLSNQLSKALVVKVLEEGSTKY